MSTYAFANFVASLAGPGGVISLGYGAGNAEEGVTVEPIEEKDLMTVGADGSIMHSLRSSNAARATVRLLKTSPVNALLQNLYNFQKNSSANWGQNVLVLADVVRGDVLTMTSVAFSRQTPVAYAKDAGMNEWAFFGSLNQQLGLGIPDLNT